MGNHAESAKAFENEKRVLSEFYGPDNERMKKLDKTIAQSHDAAGFQFLSNLGLPDITQFSNCGLCGLVACCGLCLLSMICCFPCLYLCCSPCRQFSENMNNNKKAKSNSTNDSANSGNLIEDVTENELLLSKLKSQRFQTYDSNVTSLARGRSDFDAFGGTTNLSESNRDNNNRSDSDRSARAAVGVQPENDIESALIRLESRMFFFVFILVCLFYFNFLFSFL
jgi:hypothetical protein